MAGICEGRVAIVTGAARGIGRGHALELGRQGARVVVNDFGGDVHGVGGASGPAEQVAEEIRAAGGEALASPEDISDWQGAQRVVVSALEQFGALDAVVNNAGILRDRMLCNLEEAEWDDVMRVHLKGTAGVSHWAARHWRQRAKEGAANDARIVNTSSGSGIFGNVGQSNYGAAKAGIAAFSIIAAKELERYGVTVNAIAPAARTRMSTPQGRVATLRVAEGQFDPYAPENVAPLVAWLVSAQSAGITGRVFMVQGDSIAVAQGWHRGPEACKGGARWDADELGGVVPDLIAKARPNAGLDGLFE